MPEPPGQSRTDPQLALPSCSAHPACSLQGLVRAHVGTGFLLSLVLTCHAACSLACSLRVVPSEVMGMRRFHGVPESRGILNGGRALGAPLGQQWWAESGWRGGSLISQQQA